MKNLLFPTIFACLAGLFLFGCESPLIDTPVQDLDVDLRAQGAGATVEYTEFSETVYNPCTDEDVELNGTFRTVTRFNVDANGIPHWGSATHFSNTSGVGQSSGIRYRLVGLGFDCVAPPCVGERTVSLRCAPRICPAGEGVVTYTGVVRTRLVAQGAAPDLSITAFFHITQNANGGISVRKNGPFTVECQ